MGVSHGDVSIDLDTDAAEAVELGRAVPVQVQHACVLRIDRSVVVVEEGGHCVIGSSVEAKGCRMAILDEQCLDLPVVAATAAVVADERRRRGSRG